MNMGILASGSVISKLIGFGAYPIITRIYSPSDFGVYAVYSSAIFILLPFATLRYSIAIPLPKNDILAFNILAMVFGIVVVFCGFLSLFFLMGGKVVFELFNIPEITEYWWLLVLGIMGAAIYDLFTDWATRRVKFVPVAKTDIWRSTISVITQIILGLMGYKQIGLLFGDTAHKLGGSIYLVKSFYRDIIDNIKSISKKHIAFLYRYYRNLPLFYMPSDFLLVFSSKIPVLFFAYQFGAENSGQLGLSMMIVSIPMRLIGNTTAKAYYAEIAKIGTKRKDQLFNTTKSAVKKLLIVSLLTFLLLLFSPTLFKYIFGVQWVQAGEFTRILSVYILIEFITTPLINIFNVYNEQSKLLKTSVIRSILVIVAFAVAVFFSYDVYGTLYIYTIFMCFHFLNLGYQLYRIVK